MRSSPPRKLIYRNATYVLAYNIQDLPVQDSYSYDEIRTRGAVEAGDARSPWGDLLPMWADLGGWKYAEMSGSYVRIDNRPDWKWAWARGVSQEKLIDFTGNQDFRQKEG